MSPGGTHDGMPGSTGNRMRLPVTEAASVLGISTEATRQRVKRGTLPTERDEDGNVFVLLDADSTPGGTRGDGDGTTGGTHDSTALIDAKDETIRTLREQLEAEREANRENRRIIAGLVQRVPELETAREAPPERRESPETASEEPYSTHDAPPMPETPVSDAQHKRSWWRAFFGLE
jgi:hypothetical protein